MTTNRPAPHFAPTPFRRSGTARAHRDTVEATVVVWPDTFTDAFRPGLAEDLVAVLEATGETVAVPSRWACCARTLYDGGMLDRARQSLTELVAVLEPWTSRGIPVVVPEPSCLASFRDELPRLLPDDPAALALAGLARSPAEHLLRSPGFAEAVAAREAADDVAPAASPVVVHPHCHGRAIGTPKADLEVLRWLGFAAGTVDGGCCGLAGSFGYRADHEPVSRRIGEDQWLPAVRQAMDTVDAETLVIDGFSCEMQLGHLSELESQTLVSMVRRALGA